MRDRRIIDLFAGAGVKPGFVLGKTDKHGAYTTQRPVSPADVAYTILDSLGIDPRKQLTAPDGRPIEERGMGSKLKAHIGLLVVGDLAPADPHPPNSARRRPIDANRAGR